MTERSLITRGDNGVTIELSPVAELLNVPVNEDGKVDMVQLVNACWDFVAHPMRIYLKEDERDELIEAATTIVEGAIGNRRGQVEFS